MGLTWIVEVLGRAGKDKKASPGKERMRRGTGHALLGLQQFVEPSVEYVFQAQNVEQKDEEDDDGLGEDEDVIRLDLAESLGRSPVDIEEVRRHLTAAAQGGLDWKSLYEQAVADEQAAGTPVPGARRSPDTSGCAEAVRASPALRTASRD